MKIVFFGTPHYTIAVLEKLSKTFKTNISPIVAVVTQPPRPTGRKQIMTYSAVDDWAHRKKITKFFNPVEIISNNIKADIGILAAYGKIIPQSVIEYFPYGILNIHPSLLPSFRGASPVQATIATNSQAGATIIKLDDKMDHGPIVTQFKEEIVSDDTTETLRNRLFEKSAEVLTTLIPAYINGKITLKKQDHDKATYTKLITRQDGFIDWKYLEDAIGTVPRIHKGLSLAQEWNINFITNYSTHYSPETIYQFFRAMHPWPGIWTRIQITNIRNQISEKRLKIIDMHLEESTTKNHYLVIDKVQLEGKTEVTWEEFTKTHKII